MTLEIGGAAFTALVREVTDRLANFLDSQALAQPAPPGLPPTPPPIPSRGRPMGPLLDFLDHAVEHSYNTTGPGYLAYIPGGGVPAAALADLYSLVTNRFTGLSAPAPALVALECDVIRWMCDAVGLPAGSFGVLTTGTSMATLTAVAAARHRVLGDQLQGAVTYTSAQSHHSVAKAARLAGVPTVRAIPVDSRYRLDPAALRMAISRDRDAGLRPFLVVPTAGTTNTGAVDPLPETVAIAREHGLWVHVDAAYGGFFACVPEGRARLAGLSDADSIALDPHKGLFLPYGTGALLVRDPSALEAAHASPAEYLPPPADGLVDFASLTGELSRDFRGLRLWLPLQLAGADAFREQLSEKLALAADAARRVAALPGVFMVAEPELSLFAFRVAGGDEVNRRLLANVNGRGRVFLSGTVLPDGFALRCCVLSFRTHADRIDLLLEDLAAALDEQAPA